MKRIKTRQITNKYTVRGVFFGIVFLALSVLITSNSYLFVSQKGTFNDLFKMYPGLWLAAVMPIAFGIIGYYLAKGFVKIIKKQQQLLNKEAQRSQIVFDFIENLRQGNLETAIPIEQETDKLGQSLYRLKDFLIKNKLEEEQRRIEEEQRNWVTQGLAQFSEILRNSSDNLENLSYNIIHYLVNYSKINQGGVYLLNTKISGDKYFELKACIAFDRKKFTDKTILWGEGLIGRCALEKQTIYLTDVPNDYITITSGLGEANPRAILMVPLKVNEEIHGVIELASFNLFQPYEIAFVEKTAESSASTISNVKINIQTSNLLKETQIQAEKMSQQEEELRQNLEEMQATQEESERTAIEMKGIIEAIDHAAINCEFETDGTLISVNKNFLKTFKYNLEEIEGQNLRIFFFKNDLPELDKILADLKNGHNFKGRVRRRNKTGEEIYLLSTYTPVIDNEGEIIKILSLENDVTDQVKMEEELKRSKEELGILLEEARNEVKEQFREMESVKIRNEKTLEGALDAIITTDKEGTVQFFNIAAEKLWGYDRQEVLGNNVSMLFSADTIINDEFVRTFVTADEKKVVGERREAPIKNKYGDEIPVLFLLSEAQVGLEHSFTAFIQNVEVELF
ncbi:PAS domain S-box-containing protein [Breznakibacter xylanolyticus]|uniref:PAS domain S-box-containing protein n=1 Tax=Breznakibacter xylanolyticus TaxID=990 RepID=A0A2W7N9J3_9BACT|nr:PAS domain S-box protein [Breznakibacter xylanolyticus]PZX16718.1 PAS domain S-box-containing protein [Breznakibacter xylanolyticus]